MGRRHAIEFGRGVLLAALVVAAYGPAFRAGFVWDDDDYVTRNPHLQTTDGLRRIWLEIGATPQYYPLVFTTFWAEHHVWGLWAPGYHAVNVGLHALSAVLLWRLLARLGVPGAWAAAAIFGLHPVHVESVAWITERKNVLSGVFYLMTAHAYLRFAGLDREPSGGGQRWRWYWLSLLGFTAAMLSKTVAGTWPAAMLLLIWWRRGRLGWRDAWPMAPMLLLAAALGSVTVWIEKEHVGAAGASWLLTWPQRLIIAGKALWFYLGKLVWPTDLTFIYPRWTIDASRVLNYCPPAAFLGLVIALWTLRGRIGRGPLTAALFFAGTLFPALGFFDVYPMRYSFVADHFQYLASLGPIVLLASVVSRRLDSRTALAAARPRRLARQISFAALALVLMSLTWRQTRVYESLETLWTDTRNKDPQSWIAWNNLGNAWDLQGKTEEAFACFQRAVELNPAYAEAHYNVGYSLASKGRFSEAERHYRAAIRLEPRLPRPYVNLGVALTQMDRDEEAAASYREALRIRPDYPEARHNLARVLVRLGRADQAAGELGLSDADLARLCAMEGRQADALRLFEKVISSQPTSPAAHNDLAVALAQSGRIEEAAKHFGEAVRLKPDDTVARMNLAAALEDLGRLDEAAVELRSILRIAPGHPEAARRLEQLLQRIAGQP